MKTIDVYTRSHPRYSELCAFATDVYRRTLSHDIMHFPNKIFAITDESRIYGCMGLNPDVHFRLFNDDLRFHRAMRSFGSGVRCVDQGILAIEGCVAALPVLTAIVAEYAHYQNIQKIVYASIPVSQKTIERLGFHTTRIGTVDTSSLSSEDQENCKIWLSKHKPITYILDTQNAPAIAARVERRFTRKAQLGANLKRYLHTERKHIAA